MKSVESGKDKVKKICEVLKKETIDPAKKEAEKIITKAQAEAEKIVEDARKEGARIEDAAKAKIEEERNVFQASINLACKKSIDTLKQQVEKSLFNEELNNLIGEQMKDPSVVSQIISAVVDGIKKEGLDGDLKVSVPKAVSPEKVNQELVKGVLERLQKSSVQVGEISGGAQVKIVDRNLTIDMTDDALKALLASFVREDFRSVIFAVS